MRHEILTPCPETQAQLDNVHVRKHRQEPDKGAAPNTLKPLNAEFLTRFERLQPRIAQIVRNRWADGLDPYETDNLIQAAYVHLWQGFAQDADKFKARGDGYWYAVAKKGALYELIREYQNTHRRKGVESGKPRQQRQRRQYGEVVVNAVDLLRNRTPLQKHNEGDIEESDITGLSDVTEFTHDTEEYRAVDSRLEARHLCHEIFEKTQPEQHPRIRRILTWMTEGLPVSEMARQEGVKRATIRGDIRRIRQICSAVESAKDNKRHSYGSTKDDKIRELYGRGLTAPEIARLVGTDHAFVYRRLRALEVRQ